MPQETDRAEMYAFLKQAGFATQGDVVFLESECSQPEWIECSDNTEIVTISLYARDDRSDIVEPEGIRLERFRKNPVVLYAHDYDALPIARSLWERVDMADDELVVKPQFHLDTELSREVWALLRDGFLSKWGLGFIPQAWEKLSDGSFRVYSWDLLEYSCVPVAANYATLTHALKKGRITAPAFARSLAPLGLKGAELESVDTSATERTEERDTTECNALAVIAWGAALASMHRHMDKTDRSHRLWADMVLYRSKYLEALERLAKGDEHA